MWWILMIVLNNYNAKIIFIGSSLHFWSRIGVLDEFFGINFNFNRVRSDILRSDLVNSIHKINVLNSGFWFDRRYMFSVQLKKISQTLLFQKNFSFSCWNRTGLKLEKKLLSCGPLSLNFFVTKSSDANVNFGSVSDIRVKVIGKNVTAKVCENEPLLQLMTFQ